MSSETESKLGDLFAHLPGPDGEVTERALARALAALPTQARRPDRSARALAILLAAAVGLLAVAAGALAAAGALHVSFGSAGHRTKNVPGQTQLAVPPGAQGIAATVAGRLWLSTGSGLRLQGLPVSAAALSPHALYVAVGVGRSLVALAPDGRRAWSHPTAGRVASIAWAPDGLRVAYVVRVGHGFRLYAIEGNGQGNELVDAAVRSVRPAWRADSLAIAYVAPGGRPVVYDLVHGKHTVLSASAARGVAFLSFAAHGDALAFASRRRVAVWRAGGRVASVPFGDATVAGLGWLGGDLAVGLNGTTPAVRILGAGLVQVGRVAAPGKIEALDASGAGLTLALATRGGERVVSAATSSSSRPLLRLPAGSPISAVEAR